MTPLTFKVSPSLRGWAITHNDQAMATFATREEAERTALALAVRRPADRAAKIDMNPGEGPAGTLLIF